MDFSLVILVIIYFGYLLHLSSFHYVKYCHFTWFPGVEILWKGTVSAKFQAIIRPKLCGNCAFPHHFHTRKLGEITVFYAVFSLYGALQVCSSRYIYFQFKNYNDRQTFPFFLFFGLGPLALHVNSIFNNIRGSTLNFFLIQQSARL